MWHVRACGADYDRAGVPEGRLDAVKDRATAPVLNASRLEPVSLLPAGSTTVMPLPVAVLMRSNTTGSTSAGRSPNFESGTIELDSTSRTSPAFICAMAVAIALAVLMNYALGWSNHWLTTRTPQRGAILMTPLVDGRDQHLRAVSDPFIILKQ